MHCNRQTYFFLPLKLCLQDSSAGLIFLLYQVIYTCESNILLLGTRLFPVNNFSHSIFFALAEVASASVFHSICSCLQGQVCSFCYQGDLKDKKYIYFRIFLFISVGFCWKIVGLLTTSLIFLFIVVSGGTWNIEVFFVKSYFARLNFCLLKWCIDICPWQNSPNL